MLPPCARFSRSWTWGEKKSLHAAERDKPEVQNKRKDFRNEISQIDPHRLKVIDESGVNISMTRLYGRAPKGERVPGSVPHNHGSNVTIIGSISLEGVDAAMSFEGAVNGDIFRVFVDQVLAPTLREGDVVLMDNLPSHKVSGIEEAIQSRGAQLLYLPPYSPDFSPIEECWSKVKAWLKKIEARTIEALYEAIEHAFDEVTRSDLVGWFRHCGYAVHSD